MARDLPGWQRRFFSVATLAELVGLGVFVWGFTKGGMPLGSSIALVLMTVVAVLLGYLSAIVGMFTKPRGAGVLASFTLHSLAAAWALWWMVGVAGHWSQKPKFTAAETEARERLDRRVKAEWFEKRLLSTRECEGCGLSYAELAGADLRNVRLKGAGVDGNLRGADFRGADLTEASVGGDLSQADFRDAKIDGANFSGTLRGARFDGMDLRRVKFVEAADWSGAILRGANLEGLGFYGFYGPYHRRAPTHPFAAATGGALLNHADLRGANLRDAYLTHSDLRAADLRGADLTHASMPYPEDLQDAQLSGAIGPDGRRCAEGSVARCIPEGKTAKSQPRRRGKN